MLFFRTVAEDGGSERVLCVVVVQVPGVVVTQCGLERVLVLVVLAHGTVLHPTAREIATVEETPSPRAPWSLHGAARSRFQGKWSAGL
mmetsp:Transcript_21728/g.35187  ORF Transcript_21728/g.35187 Transcript_21728/m.35187 type:complete len:88 (+) Transcript_21728:56-319(+)